MSWILVPAKPLRAKTRAAASSSWTRTGSAATDVSVTTPGSAVLGQLVERHLREVARLLGKTEGALAHDVLLDLVRAAVDRQRLRAERLAGHADRRRATRKLGQQLVAR